MTLEEFYTQLPQTPRADLEELFKNMPPKTPVRVVSLAPGEICMHQGDTQWDIYVLVSGKVNICTQKPDYSTYTLRDFSPYALFGHYEAIADAGCIIADVKAHTKCKMLVLPKEDYLKWIQSDVAILLQQARSAMATLILQGYRDRNTLSLKSDVRLALFLQNYYHTQQPERKTETITVTMSHASVAEAIGLSLRTLTRAIGRLRENKIIGSSKGKITISPAQYLLLQGYSAK